MAKTKEQETTAALEWPSKMDPEEYLKRYPEGKNADLARQIVAQRAIEEGQSVDEETGEPEYKTAIELMDELMPALEGTGEYHTQQLLDAYKAHFPDSKATEKDIAWHRSRLRKEGLLPPVKRLTAEEKKARRKARAAAKQEEQAEEQEAAA